MGCYTEKERRRLKERRAQRALDAARLANYKPLYLAARAARDYLKSAAANNEALLAQLNDALIDPHPTTGAGEMSTREIAARIIADAGGHRRTAKLINDIDAALTKAIADERAREWLPIETAPRDGTEIVVYGPIFYAWNADGSPDITERLYSCVSRYYSEGEKPMTAEGWYFGAPGIQTVIYPTHWMPLPAIRRDSTGDTNNATES